MFDFEKLDVYTVVKDQNNKVIRFLNSNQEIDALLKDYWKKSSLSSVLNLAGGTGRKNTEEKKDFLISARDNIFECASILQTVKDLEWVDEILYQELYEGYEKASKMLLGMYRSYNKREYERQPVPQEENFNL
ncbi:MAG: four helix bundle protein [Bacteroidetes bacterium CG_4_10_14_3_um_filter_31_20]|nr:MAG: four helix bundle protein [Bacteroidetes bacterium CG_4_10_14_3_um_filter_31_20]